MFARIAVVLAIALLALGLGWLAPGLPPQPLIVTRFPHPAVPAPVVRPDAALEHNLKDLRDEIGASEPDSSSTDPDALAARPPLRLPPPPPPPPPPDVGLVFRSLVRAVVWQGGDHGYALLLRDPAAETGQSRLLRVGDKFSGDWRLEELSMDEAVLRNGDQSRRVPLFGARGGG